MAQYIISTLHALAAGDLKAVDACYSLFAHLSSVVPSGNQPAPLEDDLQPYVRRIVHAVADESLSVERGAGMLIALKERLISGEPFEQIVETSLLT
jgi:hypothetical protein